MSAQTDTRLRELLKRLSPDQPTDPANAPRLDRRMVEYLERAFPPRCLEPSRETVEEHLLYAGRVALVQDLRGILDAQSDPDGEETDYPEEAPIDLDEAERAGGLS